MTLCCLKHLEACEYILHFIFMAWLVIGRMTNVIVFHIKVFSFKGAVCKISFIITWAFNSGCTLPHPDAAEIGCVCTPCGSPCSILYHCVNKNSSCLKMQTLMFAVCSFHRTNRFYCSPWQHGAFWVWFFFWVMFYTCDQILSIILEFMCALH